MCGIIGYVGRQSAAPVLLDGLRVLEYRGYDSAGLSVLDDRLVTVRRVGEVAELGKALAMLELEGTIGIAHTRWATHGEPEERNAHPHRDCLGRVSVVHNGVIENMAELKSMLLDEGHAFHSDTDTEVLAHLIERELARGVLPVEAVARSLALVQGTYGLAVLFADFDHVLVVARQGSPIVIGLGDGEQFVASDVSALAGQVERVLYLDDGEMAAVTREGVQLYGLNEQVIERDCEAIGDVCGRVDRGEYPHFMLKEMFEQPEVVRRALAGRLFEDRVVLGGLEDVVSRLKEMDRLVIVGCGSAYYAGLLAKYVIEPMCEVPVDVELASEYRYRKPLITTRTVVLAVSQSGETADTLEAIREARRKGALTLGVVNVVGSTIAREVDAGVFCHAGPEIGVASTKAYVAQVVVLELVALYLAQVRLGRFDRAFAQALLALPEMIATTLSVRDDVQGVVQRHSLMQNCLFLGRGLHAPVAYEGALKLKEVSCVHAEGYSSGEMKHGPIALIDSLFPSVVMCPFDDVYEKTVLGMQELRARKGPLIAVTSDDLRGEDGRFEELSGLAEDVIVVPAAHAFVQPILSVIVTQLLAYEMAVLVGKNPDKPRNLAKSVTVE